MDFKTCIKCKLNKPFSEFWNTKDKRGNVIKQSRCSSCVRVYRKIYEKENRVVQSLKTKVKTRNRKAELVKTFGGKCQICNCAFHLSAMDFHHIDTKLERGVSGLIQANWVKLIKEAEKCVLVCSNCHRFIHHEAREIHKDTIDMLLNKMDLFKVKQIFIESIKYAKAQATVT